MGRKRGKTKSAKFQGLDLSPNHAGFVEIDEAGLVVYSAALVCDSLKVFKAAYQMGVDATHFDVKKLRGSMSDQLWKLNRLMLVSEWLGRMLSRPAEMLCIEGYAYSKNTGAYEIGEVGGIARQLAARRGLPFRIVNPGDVKSYAGCDRKEKPFAFCLDLGVDWREANGGSKSPNAAGDLADAHTLASFGFDCWQAEIEGVRSENKIVSKLVKRDGAMCWESHDEQE